LRSTKNIFVALKVEAIRRSLEMSNWRRNKQCSSKTLVEIMYLMKIVQTAEL
jgi:hypothetical protein